MNKNDNIILKTVSVDDIIPYENNPRINDGAVSAVAESIRQTGYNSPIVVDENMVVLAGHTRLKAIKQLGWDSVQVAIAAGRTEDEKEKFRILDNKTGEIAEWDDALLQQLLENLDFEGFNFGFDDIAPEESTEVVEDDYEPELPEEPISKLGDVWQLGKHRLMVGDSTKPEDVKKLMGEEQADMLLTDPPYGVSYQAEGSATADRAKKNSASGADPMSIKNDSLEGEEFVQFLMNAFLCGKAAMKPGAVFYIWYADVKAWYFREACNRAEMEIRQVLIWKKNALVLGRQDYQWIHEPCLYGWKEGSSHLWASDRKQTTIMEFDKPAHNDIHPTMKPVALFDYQMKNNTKPGDIVLDLFAGYGTTIIAEEQNGRLARCMEFDPKYADAIIARWEKLTGQKAVLLS